jgi:hypothetical protein
MPGLMYLNFFSTGRYYGGPEEGGWWYDAGTPIASIPLPTDGEYVYPTTSGPDPYMALTEKGETLRQRIETALKAEHEWGDISSVNGGEKVTSALESGFAKPFPERTPHYE